MVQRPAVRKILEREQKPAGKDGRKLAAKHLPETETRAMPTPITRTLGPLRSPDLRFEALPAAALDVIRTRLHRLGVRP